MILFIIVIHLWISMIRVVYILQVALSEPARHQLPTAGKRTGVKVLLSRANGQALRIRR